MRAILPPAVARPNHPQPGFMHQRRGLQSLASRLLSHARRRQVAQLIVNKRQQFFRSLAIATPNGLQH
jgi:hypothetical protein